MTAEALETQLKTQLNVAARREALAAARQRVQTALRRVETPMGNGTPLADLPLEGLDPERLGLPPLARTLHTDWAGFAESHRLRLSHFQFSALTHFSSSPMHVGAHPFFLRLFHTDKARVEQTQPFNLIALYSTQVERHLASLEIYFNPAFRLPKTGRHVTSHGELTRDLPPTANPLAPHRLVPLGNNGYFLCGNGHEADDEPARPARPFQRFLTGPKTAPAALRCAHALARLAGQADDSRQIHAAQKRLLHGLLRALHATLFEPLEAAAKPGRPPSLNAADRTALAVPVFAHASGWEIHLASNLVEPWDLTRQAFSLQNPQPPAETSAGLPRFWKELSDPAPERP